MAEQMQLPGAKWFLGDYDRSEHFAAGAKRFTEAQGREYQPPESFAGVRADPDVVNQIGLSVGKQQGGPDHLSPQLHASYKAFHGDIEAQYEHLTKPESEGGMGINVEVTPHDPYSSPMEMRDDVRQNKRLKVLATETTGAGSIMPADINDKFRAIHDAFGHLSIGRGFSRHGEEAAAQHHAQMFRPESHAALFSETRAQNAALIRSGDFPEQKGYELPEWAKKSKPELPES
jgi:hypothetical protein